MVPCWSPSTWISTCRGPHDVLLDVDGIVAECVLRFPAGGVERRGELGALAYHAHALTSSAGRGLEQDRKPELLRDAFRIRGVLHGGRGAGHDRNARSDREPTRSSLAAHRGDRFGRRTDEHQPLVPNETCEPLAFREKAIPGVNSFRTDALGDFDDPVAAQIAFRRRRRADVHRLIRFTDVGRHRVRIAVDRD